MVKLNVGCGNDYREGFINIDGSSSLPRVDKIIDLNSESLLKDFHENTVDYILANDIIEHHFHWEACNLLSDFYSILKKGGGIEVRVPDCDFIINNPEYSIELKLTLLFGGQDIPQGRDPKMDESRKKFPQYFCHKFGWTMDRMDTELKKIGFINVKSKRAQSNFIVTATK